MAACPNCGRNTLRTKDWACQWCGYPLISRAFKKIDKTFKELQEERKLALRSEETELEPELEPEPDFEPEPEPPPRPRPPVKPVYQPVPEPKPVPEPPPEPKPEPAPGPETVMITPPPAKPVPQPEPEAEPQAASPPELESAPEPGQQPLAVPQSAPIILPAASAPVPKPEIKIEPEPPPQPPIKLESVSDGMAITADQLDTLYRTDKSGAHAKFSGKTLVLKGRVEKVFVREHLEIRYIVLIGSRQRMTWSMRCEFERENAAALGRLDEGQEVTVRGKYDGYSKNIIFKNCALV